MRYALRQAGMIGFYHFDAEWEQPLQRKLVDALDFPSRPSIAAAGNPHDRWQRPPVTNQSNLTQGGAVNVLRSIDNFAKREL